MVRVEFLKDARLKFAKGAKAFKAGDVAELGTADAQAAVEAGEARFTVKVRSLKPNLTLAGTTVEAGGEGFVDRVRALELEAAGDALILDGTPGAVEHAAELAEAVIKGDHQWARVLALTLANRTASPEAA